MRTYVATIGHHEFRVLRAVLSNGIDAEDTVILLRPRDDSSEQAIDAINEIRRTVREIGPDTSVVVEDISHEAFEDAILECVDILEAAEGTVIAVFDGGPREIFLPFTIAAVSCIEQIDTAFQFRDIDRKVRELSLPDIVERVPSATDETLRAVSELKPDATLPAIAETTEKSRSTVGRHLDTLEEAGAIRTEKPGKTRYAEITLGGQLRL